MLTLAVGIWLSGKTTGLPLDAGLDLVSRSEQQHVSAWKEGPDRRGTQSLLLSCFVTLFFAAWTSYHPNVPPAGSGGNTFLARLKWVSVAMFAPEVVLWKAWSQFFGAKRFQRQINKAIAESASKKRNPLAAHFSSNNLRTTGANSTQLKAATWSVAARSHTEAAREGEYLNNRKIIAQEPWTLRQAFFASTGGVAVRTKTFHSTDFTCFTEKGLLILAKCGALPSLPFDQVEDKSKADTFQKIIVCVQGLWFVAQTIARWAQHLPVSLLELHAFIHVFCALAMFGFWWRKGYDVGSPIVLDDEVALDFAALFSVETAFLRADSWSDKLQWSMSDTVRQHCSHHGKAPTRFECIRNAHEFPPVTIASWAWIKAGFIEEWMKPRPVDKMKIIEHCRRAERAVLCLQQHDVHVRWLDIEPQFPNNKFGWLSTFSFPNGPYVAPSLGNISGEGSLEWTDLAHRQLWNRQMPDEIACHWGDGSYYLCRAAEQQAYSSQSVVPGSRTVATTDWSRAASTHSLPPPVAHSASWPTPYRHAASKSDLGARAATSPAIVGGAESIDLPLIPKHLAKDSNHSKNDPDASTISAESYDPRPDAQLRREVGSFTVWYKELRLDKVALVFFCAAYGGAHTAAWSHPFPTTVEMWLWRGVCLFMLNIPISMLLVVFLKTLEVSLVLWGHWERMQRTLKWLYTNCAIVAMCTLGMYHFARMFLLAEALAALRKPVPGTYDDVNWSKYVPHIN